MINDLVNLGCGMDKCVGTATSVTLTRKCVVCNETYNIFSRCHPFFGKNDDAGSVSPNLTVREEYDFSERLTQLSCINSKFICRKCRQKFDWISVETKV